MRGFSAVGGLTYSRFMFRRRFDPGYFSRARDFVWPRTGWSRSSRYIMHRVRRLPGSPYSIAAGFACGGAISFTPFVGLHFALAALWAWLIRANVLASAIGTAVGNPWTFPFIWLWIYKLGMWMGAAGVTSHPEALNFTGYFAAITKAALRADFHYLWETAWPVLWPMVLGGIPTAALVWVALYVPVRAMVAAYQRRRHLRRLLGKRSESKA